MNETKRTCPYCHQEVSTKVGLGNVKNLFRKPTLNDWITLALLVMVLLAAWAYNHDTKACRETVNNLDEICAMRIQNASQGVFGLRTTSQVNISFGVDAFP